MTKSIESIEFQSALKEISAWIDARREPYAQVSDAIWSFAETCYQEHRSAAALADLAEREGFAVQRGVAGMETAFVCSWGNGKPVIAFLGEYDALANLSQVGGVAAQQPVLPGGNGHGCGHNLLGTGALAGAAALKSFMEKHRLQGTVRFYGCPAEEGGAGKTFMVREGLFDDVDLAITWHPMSMNMTVAVESAGILANLQAYFRFKGRAAHAAAAPHLGRSALDAAELMNIGVQFLREHIIPEARIHYSITDAGGFSPNVVQPTAELLYLVRAPHMNQVREIYERVCDIARGAALMTGTTVEIEFDKAISNLLPNVTLEDAMQEVFEALGGPVFDEEDHKFAQSIYESLTEEARQMVPPNMRGKVLADAVMPLMRNVRPSGSGSTDVGDVSWVTPTVQCVVACEVLGTQPHTWQWVATGVTPLAHKGMLHAGKVMAGTGLYALLHPDVVEKAKAEHARRTAEMPYVNPLPPDLPPPVNQKHFVV